MSLRTLAGREAARSAARIAREAGGKAGRTRAAPPDLSTRVHDALVELEGTLGRGVTAVEIVNWGKGCSGSTARIAPALAALAAAGLARAEDRREAYGPKDTRIVTRRFYRAVSQTEVKTRGKPTRART